METGNKTDVAVTLWLYENQSKGMCGVKELALWLLRGGEELKGGRGSSVLCQ